MANSEDNYMEDDEILDSDFEDSEELRNITVIDEDGEETELCVIDAVERDGVQYLLCVESDWVEEDDNVDAEAYLFKEILNPDDENTMLIQPVEDDEEFDRIIKFFESDDYDLT